MKKFWRVCRVLLSALLIALLVSLIGYNVYTLAARASGRALPKVFGYTSAIIISGSMSGAMEINDMVIARVQPSYAQRDVILFRDAHGTIVCHRIVALEDGSYITKGDANNVADADPVPPERVIGKVKLVIPKVGVVQVYMSHPLGMAALAAVVILVVMLPYFGRKKRDEV